MKAAALADLAAPGGTASAAANGGKFTPLLAAANGEGLAERSPRVAALLPLMIAALATQDADRPGHLFDLDGLDAAELELIDGVIGAGEVSATVALPDGIVAQIRESVMAGLWRVRFTGADGRLVADYLEVGAIPEAVRRAAAMTRRTVATGALSAPSPTALALLSEIAQHVAEYAARPEAAARPSLPGHTITLSLLPVSDADMAFLHQTLGDGPVQIVSRGHGSCRVLATATRHVWSVQYFNASSDLVLDSLEIGDVPPAACAATEDFRDSAERLRQIEQAYFT
ncbi:hydrogenase expression/formation protein [Blastochloris tepida]|uniref:Hydrogenase expression/formation protein HupH n=1 Tax=Blastochloris tepida TaxID=2233851 RepID=A0A348G363_9HYPH|nr:hydrogenase expression/formation protein [Blastochloris tepida]BBF93996.1 hydrogenase expression/formation protein HupH [Blastochloris tepida]